MATSNNRNNRMTQKMKAELIGTGLVWISGFIFGAICIAGGLRDPEPVAKKPKPGTYVDWRRTDLSLMAIGINALKDGLYDEYELKKMLETTNIN